MTEAKKGRRPRPKPYGDDVLPRMIRFDVTLKDRSRSDQEHRALHRQVLDEIKLYRVACQQAFAALTTVELAGATVERTEEKGLRVLEGRAATKDLKNLLARIIAPPGREKDGKLLATGTAGKTPAYFARSLVLEELAPGWKSCMWDELRRDVETAWSAKDPDLKASRGFLLLNQAREVNRFRRKGLAVTKTKDVTSNAWLEEKPPAFALNWNKDLGTLRFKIVGKKRRDGKRRIDAWRWGAWKRMLSGELPWGTPRLTEEDGKLVMFVPVYEKIVASKQPNKDKVLEVVFDPLGDATEFIHCSACGAGMTRVDQRRSWVLSASAAIGRLDDLRIQKDKLAEMRRACGSRFERSRGAGNKEAHLSIIRRQENLTIARDNTCKEWNHQWTARIIMMAAKESGCGAIVVTNIPSDLDEEKHGIFGLKNRPWVWSQFKDFLKYKAERERIAVSYKVADPGIVHQAFACKEDLEDLGDQAELDEDADAAAEVTA